MEKKQIIAICVGAVLPAVLLVILFTGGFKEWEQRDWNFRGIYDSGEQTTESSGEENTENSTTDTTSENPIGGTTGDQREDLEEVGQQQTQGTVNKPVTKPDPGNQENETVENPTDENGRLTYEAWKKLSVEEQKAYKATFNGDIVEYIKWYNDAKAAYDAKHPATPIVGGQITLPE